MLQLPIQTTLSRRPAAQPAERVLDAAIQPLAPELDLEDEIGRLIKLDDVWALAQLYDSYTQISDALCSLGSQPRAGAAEDFIRAEAERAMSKAYMIADRMQFMHASENLQEDLCGVLFDCALRMGHGATAAVTVTLNAINRRKR